MALLLGVGAACCGGLVLGHLGRFQLLPVAVLGAVGFLAGWWRRAVDTATADTAAGRFWRIIDGPLVFVLAFALYAPGYDTTLYGADATVYLGSGAYLARHGSFTIDAPLLRDLPGSAPEFFFPPYTMRAPTTRVRSPAGLTFESTDDKVYSTFAKFPSVWLGIGFATAGIPGAIVTSPLLGAAGVMFFYLFARRTLGTLAALCAAGLLAPALPQLVSARVSLAEIGAQFFLWGGLLALSRWYTRGGLVAAVAAGLGFGCTALARAEFLVFLPLALVVGWLLGGGLRLPALTVALALALGAYAVFLLITLPSHYHQGFADALAYYRLQLVSPLTDHPWAVGALFAALVGGGAWGALRLDRGRDTMGAVACALTAMFVVLWVCAYGALTTEHAFAGARLLPRYTSWLVLGLATFGVPLLARAWWRVPAGRVAFLVGGVAAVHFFYDPHATPLPLWEGRRFVPAALPLLFAAAAVAVAWIARFGRAAGVGLALAAVATNLLPSRLLWRTPYLAGSSQAVAGIVALIPEDNAVVLVDPAFFTSLLDVPLWLIHGREAIQSSGVAGDIASVGTLALLMAKAGRPLYLVRHSMLPPPTQPQVQFTPVGEAVYPVMPIGDSATQLLPARVYRVTWTAALTFQG